jgi:hypothetical protein
MYISEKDLFAQELVKKYKNYLSDLGKACLEIGRIDALYAILSEALSPIARADLSELFGGAKETKGFFTFAQLAQVERRVPDPPMMDHRLYFKKGRVPFAVVSAPYSSITIRDMKELIKWADEYNMRIDVYPGLSHYYIGRTNTIIVRRQELR